jgi:hypothetical protein
MSWRTRRAGQTGDNRRPGGVPPQCRMRAVPVPSHMRRRHSRAGPQAHTGRSDRAAIPPTAAGEGPPPANPGADDVPPDQRENPAEPGELAPPIQARQPHGEHRMDMIGAAALTGGSIWATTSSDAPHSSLSPAGPGRRDVPAGVDAGEQRQLRRGLSRLPPEPVQPPCRPPSTAPPPAGRRNVVLQRLVGAGGPSTSDGSPLR